VICIALKVNCGLAGNQKYMLLFWNGGTVRKAVWIEVLNELVDQKEGYSSSKYFLNIHNTKSITNLS
jgi:hypothetical protein